MKSSDIPQNAVEYGSYDYIIIGAGSAGCVLAYRLGEDPSARILVLEAGGSDKSLIVSMPAALSIPMNTKRFNWGMKTEPEPGLDGRVLNLPRGKGLGGSSSINGMCYVRGNPMDYELWSALGADGWHWENVLPYFQRAETVQGGGELRGTTGPLQITRGTETNPLYQAFIRAGAQAGYAVSANMNERQHEGLGPMEMSVGNGKRSSTNTAYLSKAVQRGNVRVQCHTTVERILFDQNQAVGVLFKRGDKMHVARIGREVILSAGSIMSPTVLKRSGIGPSDELRDHEIAVVSDHSEVGENLMDHLELWVQQECLKPISLYSYMNWWGKAKIGMCWLWSKKGLGATNHFESGGHIRSRAGIVYPDIQYHFLPIAISYDGKTAAAAHGYQVHVGTKRSKSRGWVKLRDRNSGSLPKVRFNYMTHEDDWIEMRACIRLTREVFQQEALVPYRGRELAPGDDCQSDDALDQFIKDTTESACHPCGTCRMGNDTSAVVDPDCRVKGVTNLRVIDSSIMPQATAGDLNGPTIMLAERASDLIRGKTLPAATIAPILADSNWATVQRSPTIHKDFASDREGLRKILLENAQS